MRKTRVLLATVPVLAVLVVVLPAFGSAPRSTAAHAASACNPPKGKVSISYWAWNTAFAPAIRAFNATHPKIHVTFDLVSRQDYQQLFNALTAHNAPDVAQIEYEVLPAFRLRNGVKDISSCAPVKNIRTQFSNWAVDQVGDGASAVYGVPQDVEPLALLYRKDVFTKYNLQVPTTWAQYQADALALKAANPSIKWVSMTNADSAMLYGLDWQAGAHLFSYSANAFTFYMDSPQANKVAAYWDNLVSAGVVNTTAKPFSPDIYAAWNNGTIATMIVPAYMPDTMVANATLGSGNWRVANIPQWTAGSHADGNSGGSSIAVMAGTKQPYAAAVFADWLGSNTNALEITLGGAKPELAAANSYKQTSIVGTVFPYFGGQQVLAFYQQASKGVDKTWQWAPDQIFVDSDLQNNLASALNGQSTIAAAFLKTQTEAAADLRSLGVTVKTK